MKTNIQIIIDDDERLDLGRKYHDTQNKHLITRDELRTIVHEFMQEILDSDQTVKKTTNEVVSTGSWRKIYYYEGRKYSKKEWEQLPDSPRKFYGLED